MPQTDTSEVIKAAQALMTDENRDLLVFSGDIEAGNVNTFIKQLLAHKTRRSRALFFLCTYGGDPHAAYRLARVLRRCYPDDVRILIPSECKSAGTLIALCADSLGFSDFGELGPLDTQLSRPDELLQRSSGLEVFTTLQYLTDHAFACFEQNMLTIIRRSGQTVSTRLASEIASRLATGLIKPITAQLDPYRIGIAQRGLEVTKVYGRQLANTKNLRFDADKVVEHLVKDYPTHAFVIDQQEASTLFQNVDGFSPLEQAFFEQLPAALDSPADNALVINFASYVEAEASKEQQESENAKQRSDDHETPAGNKGKSSQPTSRRNTNGRIPSQGNEGESGTTSVSHTA
jgi:ClpP class serine protease